MPLNEEIFQIACQLKRIAVGDDDIGDLAGFESANLVGQTQNLCRIERDGFQSIVVGKAVGGGVGGVLAEAAGERIVEAAHGELDAGLGELGRLAQQAIVGVVFFQRESKSRTQNNRNIFGTKQILYFVSLLTACEDHFQFLLVAKFDAVADIAGAIGEYEDRQLAAHHRSEGFEFDIALEIGRAAVAHGLGVVAGAIDPIGQFNKLLFEFLFGFGVRPLPSGKSSEIKRARLNGWKVHDHDDAAFDLHVVHSPASQAEGGGLAAEDRAAARRIKAPASWDGEDFGDAGGARNRNVFAGRRNGGSGNDVRIEVAGFRRIDCCTYGADFAQAHLRNGIKQAGINLQAFAVNDLRAGGNFNAGADGGNFSVLDDQSAIINRGAGQCENFGVRNSVGGGGLRSLCMRGSGSKQSETCNNKKLAGHRGDPHWAPPFAEVAA